MSDFYYNIFERRQYEIMILDFCDAVEEFKEWLRLRKLSEETVRGYGMDVLQYYEWRATSWNAPINVIELAPSDFEGYVAHLLHERNCQPRSVNRKLNGLSTFFECMIRKEYISKNPIIRLHRLKVIEQERVYLVAEEVEQILEAITHPVVNYFLKTMAFTGMRVSECRNLQLEHINFNEGYVLVVNGKGGKSRRIPLNEELAESLQYYNTTIRDADSPYFFALKRTGKVSAQYVNRLLREATERAGIKKHVTSHILRHSFASYLIKKGVHVAVIQKLLGHASLRTTSTYLHVDDTELVDAIGQVTYE